MVSGLGANGSITGMRTVLETVTGDQLAYAGTADGLAQGEHELFAFLTTEPNVVVKLVDLLTVAKRPTGPGPRTMRAKRRAPAPPSPVTLQVHQNQTSFESRFREAKRRVRLHRRYSFTLYVTTRREEETKLVGCSQRLHCCKKYPSGSSGM